MQKSKYPSKHWAENVGFELLELNIADAGSGYSIPPQIKISGGGGSGASPSYSYNGQSGGSGVVVIRYKYQ